MRMTVQIASAPTTTEPTTMMAINAGLGNPPEEDESLPFELSAAFEPEADAAEEDPVDVALEDSPEPDEVLAFGSDDVDCPDALEAPELAGRDAASVAELALAAVDSVGFEAAEAELCC